jgi:hypothetical protein
MQNERVKHTGEKHCQRIEDTDLLPNAPFRLIHCARDYLREAIWSRPNYER